MLNNIWKNFKEFADGHGAGKVWQLTHNGLHLAYFGLVFVEGHGLYASAAGGLFLLVALGFLLGFHED